MSEDLLERLLVAFIVVMSLLRVQRLDWYGGGGWIEKPGNRLREPIDSGMFSALEPKASYPHSLGPCCPASESRQCVA
jgi:hypothetical protein